jgi:hypothetical protein
MTFQPSFSNGARWRLIETNGVLFAKTPSTTKETPTFSRHDIWVKRRYGNLAS